MRKLKIGCMAVSLWAVPLLAQPTAVPRPAPPKPPPEACERAFSFEFGLQIASTAFPDNGAVVGFPVQIRASEPTLVITLLTGPHCDRIVGPLRTPQNDFVWP